VTSRLERRYRRMVRFYPAEWRQRYGEELVSTLLDASEGRRRRPSPREAAALIAGAARQRIRQTGISAPAAVVRDGLHIGATLIVAANASISIFAAYAGSGTRVAGMPSEWRKAELLWVLAFVALVQGSRILAPALVAVVAGICATSLLLEVSHVPFTTSNGWSVLLVATIVGRLLLPAVIVVWLAARGEHPARSPLWLLAVAPAASVLTQGFDAPLSIGVTTVALTVPLLIAALLWAPVDPRPAIGAAVLVAASSLILVAVASEDQGQGLPIPFTWTGTAIVAALLTSLAVAGPVAAVRAFRR
jgi:hypothetical protein